MKVRTCGISSPCAELLNILLEREHPKCTAKFTNGRIKRKHSEKISFEYLTNKEAVDARKRQQRVLVAKTERLGYVGKNFPQLKTRSEKYYVGIHDKTTGKIRICDADIFTMQPQPPGREETDQLLVQQDQVLGMSYMEKNDLLTSAFGSSKKQRAMESRLKHHLKGDALDRALGSAVDHALTEEHRAPLESGVPAPEETSLIPPCNKEALTPEDVYRLTDIISQAELAAITNQARILFDCTAQKIQEWKQEEVYPAFILKQLAILPVSDGPRWLKVKCLMYLNYMITMSRLKAQELKKKDILPLDWSDAVKNQLLERFTLQVAGDIGRKPIRCMPSRLRDKLTSHLLVLALHIDHFSTEIDDLQKDLKISEKKLSMHFRALGCHVKTQRITDPDSSHKKVVHTATLSLPLQFPQNIRHSSKGRRGVE